MAGVSASGPGCQWQAAAGGHLRLHIPAGPDRLVLRLWLASASTREQAVSLVTSLPPQPGLGDLDLLTRGGPRCWPEVLKTRAVIGADSGPLAIDVLNHPVTNPWFCQMRLSGLDFFADGDRAAVCTWDGDVWLVRGLNGLPRSISGPAAAAAAAPELSWQRIASGLFQPLGLKILAEQIYVSCRNQIVVLRDLNGDGETDFYENFNSDHQVTEHFHEFAMGLQADGEGNLYYAKGRGMRCRPWCRITGRC